MSFWDGSNWVADTPPAAATPAKPESRVKRLAAAALEASLITALTFGLIAGTAFAARGGGQGGSLSLVMVEDTNGDGAPNLAEAVTFSLFTSADKPYVNVRCYQGTAFVYDAWAGFYAGAWFGQTFTLSSSYWTAGAADCVARLVTWSKNGRENTLATLRFLADA